MTGAVLAAERRLIRIIGRVEPGDVGDILAKRQLAVDVQPGQRLIVVELLGERSLPGR